MSDIRDNVKRARDRVAAAAGRSGRSSDDVTIVGVTKTFGADVVTALVEAGVTDVGENRVQEFLVKAPEVEVPCRWHLVGHLQSNKASKLIGRFHLIQSIDSVRIAQTLDRLGAERNLQSRVLLQVNTSGESSKHGFAEDAIADAAGEIAECMHVTVAGLMTIGPVSQAESATRDCFRRLYALREKIRSEHDLELRELSMGMSGDFEAAIEEGATIVRLGRILTGERGPVAG